MNKQFAISLGAVLGACASFGGAAVDAMTTAPDVVMTSLKVQQRYPWNGKVDIDFTFTSTIPEAFAFINFKASYEDKDGKTVEVPMRTFDQFETAFCTNAGTYRVTWDSSADAPNLSVTNLKYSVTANMAKYMVIDLSKGSAATADDPYPITYLEECPDPSRDDGGWTDEYKTTKMVFRLIQPGSFKMGWGTNWQNWNDASLHTATITRPYYLAIFECTQGQAKQVKGSYFGSQNYEFTGGRRDLRPVGCASYLSWRGSPANGICWPNTGSTVDPTSFIGLLREKTGNNVGFDLPTETEWEYAARAGDTDAWGGDGLKSSEKATDGEGPTSKTKNTTLNPKARYYYNDGLIDNGDGTYTDPGYKCDETHGTAVVGSYKPNAWGLYDVMGNMREIVLDYWVGSKGSSATIDDVGPVVPAESVTSTKLARPFRGGCWSEDARTCSLIRRWNGSDSGYVITGARLCWRFPFAGTGTPEPVPAQE